MSRSIQRRGYANGVYAAEGALFESPGSQLGRHRSISEPMALADARDLVAKYVNGCVVERKQGTTARHTHATFHPADPPVISLARGAPKWVVCHEIAHAINEGRDRGHGAYFRHDYLVIVELELGPWWARRLRAAFKKVGYES